MAAEVAGAQREERLERMNGGFNSTMQMQADDDESDEEDMLAQMDMAAADVRRRAQILQGGSSPELGDDEADMQRRDEAMRVSYEEADEWLSKGKPAARPSSHEDGGPEEDDMEARIANDCAAEAIWESAVFASVDGAAADGTGEGAGEPEMDEEDQEELEEDEYAEEMQREMMGLMPEAAPVEEVHRPQTASAREVEQELDREVERMISEDEDNGDDDAEPRRPKDGGAGGEAQVFTLGDDDDDGGGAEDDEEEQARMEQEMMAGVEALDSAAPRALPISQAPLGFSGALPLTPRKELNADSEMDFVASLREGQMADLVNKSAKEFGQARPGSSGGGLAPLQPLGQGLAGRIRPGSRGR